MTDLQLRYPEQTQLSGFLVGRFGHVEYDLDLVENGFRQFTFQVIGCGEDCFSGGVLVYPKTFGHPFDKLILADTYLPNAHGYLYCTESYW